MPSTAIEDEARRPPGRSSSRWFAFLAGIVVVALAARAVHVLVVLPGTPTGLDAIWYVLQGTSLRQGTGYVLPSSLFAERTVPTAVFPPAYPAYQALWQTLFGAGPRSIGLAGLPLAAVTVTTTGLIGRRVAGERAGLLAAAVVALDPALIAVDGSTMSESLAVPVVALTTLVALRIARHGLTTGWLSLLAALCGIAVLTRTDLALYSLVLLVPLVLVAPARGRLRRIGIGAAGVAAAMAVVLPWVVRNQAEVGAFTLTTLSPGTALAGSNCDLAWYGPGTGNWDFGCVTAGTREGLAETEQTDAHIDDAVAYIRAHPSRLAVVLPARAIRVWGVWGPGDHIAREVVETRSERWQQLTFPVNLLIGAVGLAGLVSLVRHRPRWPWWPLLAVPVSVTLTAIITHGNPRFAAVAHPALAVGIAALATRWTSGRRAGGPDEADPGTPVPSADDVQETPTRSTTNTNVSLGLMAPAAPRLP